MTREELKSIICKWCGDSAKRGKECHIEKSFIHLCPVEVLYAKLNEKDKQKEQENPK